MHEYVTVSSSSYDPAGLAAKLTEKSAEGWEVVTIVPTGGDVTAFCRRAISAGEPASEGAPAEAPAEAPAVVTAGAMAGAATVVEPSLEPAASSEPSPVSEPAGWAVAPEPEPTPVEPAPQPAAEPVVAQPEPAPAPAVTPAATPTVPAGWYADPAGRYELRYWDGNQWTEHVARGGAQYTDPPVA